jgi:hypothetical protein
LYVVVEFDPEMAQHHVLFPRFSMAQVHATLASATQHRDWYVEAIYTEDPAVGLERVGIYRLTPV